MTKTLIAILALGSVAMAVNPKYAINTDAQNTFHNIDDYGIYSANTNQEYIFSFTIAGTSSLNGATVSFLSFNYDDVISSTDNDRYALMTQAGQYVGMRSSSTGQTWMSSTWDADTQTNKYTVTGFSGDWGTMSNLWISRSSNGNNAALPKFQDTSYSIEVTNGNTYITMNRTDGVTDQVVLEGYKLDATKLAFEVGYLSKDNAWGSKEWPGTPDLITYGNIQFELKSVPEPTTGSLSLLALAGLCARRRKK